MSTTACDMLGYADPGYARSLVEFGEPRYLEGCQGWILVRSIEDFPDRDATHCYPLFACRDWSSLAGDLQQAAAELVCVTMVTDPFGEFRLKDLRRAFPDVLTPFKQHFIADLRRSPGEGVTAHHRYYARRALNVMQVEVCPQPSAFLDTWKELYQHLVERHQLKGIHAFSPAAFAALFELPGVVILVARRDGVTLAAQVWMVQGQVAYSHLAAASPEGYRLRAFYALYAGALEYFHGRVAWLNLGGGAGWQGDQNDGLSQFKRGWSSSSRTAYFCGRILQPDKYAFITQSRAVSNTRYFPAYRFVELA